MAALLFAFIHLVIISTLSMITYDESHCVNIS